MSIRSSWSIVSFKVCVSLLIFCLVDLSIVVSGVLKSPTITVLLLISSFILVSICLTYCGASPSVLSGSHNNLDLGTVGKEEYTKEWIIGKNLNSLSHAWV